MWDVGGVERSERMLDLEDETCDSFSPFSAVPLTLFDDPFLDNDSGLAFSAVRCSASAVPLAFSVRYTLSNSVLLLSASTCQTTPRMQAGMPDAIAWLSSSPPVLATAEGPSYTTACQRSQSTGRGSSAGPAVNPEAVPGGRLGFIGGDRSILGVDEARCDRDSELSLVGLVGVATPASLAVRAVGVCSSSPFNKWPLAPGMLYSSCLRRF